MEAPHSLSYFPDSGESAELLTDDPAAAAKVKLMCSYGGRIQYRHDNQLAYVGGETKIIALDRSVRFPAFYARLASLLPAPVPDFLVKYQLPGQNLEVLISVINDDDIDNMIFEYDLLHVPSSPRPVSRLRFFLFPLPGPRNTSPPLPDSAPDFLFGLDTVQDPVPPPLTSPVKDDRAEVQPQQIAPGNQQTAVHPNSIDEIPATKAVPAEEIQQQQAAAVQRNIIDEIPASKAVPAAEIQQQQAAAVQRNSIDEIPASKAVPAAEIQQQKAAAVKRDETDEMVVYTKAQRPTPYWQSMMGEQPLYMIPGPYPGGAYYAAVPTLWRPAAAKVSGGAEAAGFAVVYDSSGRAVYYTRSVLPAYQTVASVGSVSSGVEAKPPQDTLLSSRFPKS